MVRIVLPRITPVYHFLHSLPTLIPFVVSPLLPHTLWDAHDTDGDASNGIRGGVRDRVARKPVPDGNGGQMDVLAKQDAKLGKGREGSGPASDVWRNVGVERVHKLCPQPGGGCRLTGKRRSSGWIWSRSTPGAIWWARWSATVVLFGGRGVGHCLVRLCGFVCRGW